MMLRKCFFSAALTRWIFAKSVFIATKTELFFVEFFSSILSITLWLLPDIVMFITTIAAYVILRKLTAPPPAEDLEENATPSTSGAPDTEEDDGPSYTFENYLLLKRTGKFAMLMLAQSRLTHLHVFSLF